MAGADTPPIGTVIQNDDGSFSIWNAKSWLPAAKGADGKYRVDTNALSAAGLSTAQTPVTTDDSKAVDEYRAAASQMEHLSDLSRDFITRNARTGTGGWLGLPFAPSIAKAISGTSSDLSAMDRDTTGMATALRAPGQRLTQMEFLQNVKSSPTIKATGDKNIQANASIQNANVMAQAKASFYASYLAHHRSLAGVIPNWLAFKAQHFGDDGTYSQDPISHQQAAGVALHALGPPPVLNPSSYMSGP
jgi:hypothetical protein